MSVVPSASRLGRYELRSELGRGAMGVVYRAFDTVLQRDVALKIMQKPSSDSVQIERFLREARTAGALQHRNIVSIHELGRHEETYFIAMELLDGEPLDEVVRSGELPPVNRRLDLVARICDGLDFAHRAGIVHRDIKPANVFLSRDGAVKILDFGIAKIAASDTTRTGLVIGTVDYMSPEQVRAAKDLDGRSDIFSAGCILYELLFRRRPFTTGDLGSTLHRILHQPAPGMSLFEQCLPPDLADVLRRSLDKRREARYARAGEMAEALDGLSARVSGRAGTRLEERLEEIVRSGVLEKTDEEIPVGDVISIENDPSESDTLDGRVAAASARRSRSRLLVGTGAVVLAAVVGAAGFALFGPGRDTAQPGASRTPPEVSHDASTDPGPQPPDGTAATGTAPEPGDAVAGTRTEPAVSAAPSQRTLEGDDGADRTHAAAARPSAVETQDPIPAAPRPPGTLEIRAMPWADIAWIEDRTTGERLPSELRTPVRLQLPAGDYRIRLVHPYGSGPLEEDVTVTAESTAELRLTMPGFDAATLSADLLRSEGARP